MRRCLEAVLLPLLVAGSSSAQNLLYNPDFSLGQTAWIQSLNPPAVVEVVAEDAAGDPASGSLSITVTSPDQSAVFQCTEGVFEGITYDFGARVLVPAEQAGTGFAVVLVLWYDNTFCFGEDIGDANTPGIFDSAAGFWEPIYATVTAPVGTLSAFVALLSDADSGTHAALFDGVILAEQGTEALPLFEDTFERGNLSAWHLSTP